MGILDSGIMSQLLTDCPLERYNISINKCPVLVLVSLIARFIGQTWGPSVADRTQMGPMMAPCTLPSGLVCFPVFFMAASLAMHQSISRSRMWGNLKIYICKNNHYRTTAEQNNARTPCVHYLGPLLQTRINFDPHMSCKMWDEFIYPFTNSNGCTVDVWEYHISYNYHII